MKIDVYIAGLQKVAGKSLLPCEQHAVRTSAVKGCVGLWAVREKIEESVANGRADITHDANWASESSKSCPEAS